MGVDMMGSMAIAGTGLDAVSVPGSAFIGRTPPPTPSSLLQASPGGYMVPGSACSVGSSSPYQSAPPPSMPMGGRAVPTFSSMQGPPPNTYSSPQPMMQSGIAGTGLDAMGVSGTRGPLVAPAERFSQTMPTSMNYPSPTPPGSYGNLAVPPATMQPTMVQSLPAYGPFSSDGARVGSSPVMLAPPSTLGPSVVQFGAPPMQFVQQPVMVVQQPPIQYVVEAPVPDTYLQEDGWFPVDHSGARVEPHWMGGEWWLTAPVDYKGLERMPEQYRQERLNRVDNAVQELDDTGRIPNLPRYYHSGKECPIS